MTTAAATTPIGADEQISSLYRARRTPQFVDVPDLPYLMVDGRGDPNGNDSYADAIRALFTVSYGVKFALKHAFGLSVKVAPLEGLWWSQDMRDFRTGDRSGWEWTAMIRQPSQASVELALDVADEAARKKGLPVARQLRHEALSEGRCAQILHIGPYSAEGPTIERLHAFIAEAGCSFDGRKQRHHEIYLGDPRRSAPERLRTIVRQPVVCDL
jgi:hypothetical protein